MARETFLLKIKRKQSGTKEVVCISRDRMLDSLDSSFVGMIDRSVSGCFESYPVWVRLWKILIGMAIALSEDVMRVCSSFLAFCA